MNHKHYRRMLQDSIEAPEQPRLEKMSRPRIRFPNLDVPSRPDQEVQPMENKRQKDLYSRKVVQSLISTPENQAKLEGLRPDSRKEVIEDSAKRISSRLDRRTLGLNYGGPRPLSSVVTGKLRSKFEEGDEDHSKKLQERKDKILADQNKYHADLRAWRAKTSEFPQGSTALWDHISNRPQPPKKPRTPSKKLKSTKDLSPDQIKARGRGVESTIEHEALHNLMDHVQSKYGESAHRNLKSKLLSAHDPETLKVVGNFIEETRGYKRKSDHFDEEILTHSRDLLVNPKVRNDFKNYIARSLATSKDPGKDPESDFKSHIKSLKQGHQRAYEISKKVTPADIGVGQPSAAPKKLAASELAKAPIENYDSSIAREKPENPMKERYRDEAKTKEVAPGIYHHALFSNKDAEALHMLSDNKDPFHPKATVYSQLIGDVDRFKKRITVQLSQVHPEHKGKGHGKALYEFALAHHGELRSDQLLSAQAHEVYQHLEGKGAKVKFGEWDTGQRHEASSVPGFQPGYKKLAASEKIGHDGEMDKAQTLQHYSQKQNLSNIDPAHQGTGADSKTRGRAMENKFSFYYRKGAPLPQEDSHIHGAASSKYEIDIPDDAKIYDIGTDPEGHIEGLKEQSVGRPVNPGVITMDDVHGKLKELGYHGFSHSSHPSLSSVVGLYHSAPVAREEKLK